MTNIELVNAINDAVAAGRTVKTGYGFTLRGAFLRKDIMTGVQYVAGIYSDDYVDEKAATISLLPKMSIRSFFPAETDVKVLQAGKNQ
jgi:hypothetical protein